MLVATKTLARDFIAAVVRVVLLFLVLSIALDSMTRVYYSYMPITTWMNFESVRVEQRSTEPYVIIKRQPKGSLVAIAHRTLLVSYPEQLRGCSIATQAVLDDTGDDTVVVQLDHLLNTACPDVLGPLKTNATLQVSYIFDFPYGVKRSIVRQSNRFSIWHDGTNYHIGPPLTRNEMARQ